jgi:TRAP-type C4-dicarboxylate transport system permease large subunit
MLAVAQVPAQVLGAMQAISAGPVLFLILTALLFILLGAVLEGLPAVIILLPTFLPVVKQLNIDLVHFSIVVVAATGIGLFLPPIGVGLFISCGNRGHHHRPRDRPDDAVHPVSLCWPAVVILFPQITLVLPRLFGALSTTRLRRTFPIPARRAHRPPASLPAPSPRP